MPAISMYHAFCPECGGRLMTPDPTLQDVFCMKCHIVHLYNKTGEVPKLSGVDMLRIQQEQFKAIAERVRTRDQEEA